MPGSDLLSRALRQSTIGAERLNDRVRNGIGWGPLAITTRQTQDCHYVCKEIVCLAMCANVLIATHRRQISVNQANRVISTGKLHVSLHFHTQPINVVVFHDSQGSSRIEGGFPLRCFQRLSLPFIATLQCRWRDNSSTRGTSTPVLSY